LTNNGFELKQVKGLSNPAAVMLQDLLLPLVYKDQKKNKISQKVVLPKQSALSLPVKDTGVEEAYLVYVRNKGGTSGLIACF